MSNLQGAVLTAGNVCATALMFVCVTLSMLIPLEPYLTGAPLYAFAPLAAVAAVTTAAIRTRLHTLDSLQEAVIHE